MVKEYKYLTPEQVEHFLAEGWVRIPEAFSREKAAEFSKDVWIRLGFGPDDKSKWVRERINMPWHTREDVRTFSPKAWGAMCELLGGEDRVDPNSASWGDSFILNFGTEEYARDDLHIDPRDLDNWHADGDFFVHFLDSPEQGLLIIPLFSDIAPRGGGTMISPDGMEQVARYLAAHPEGVLPVNYSFVPQTPADAPRSTHYYHREEIKKCKRFAEMTGNTGDVILMHPLMAHSASRNQTRAIRIITNPPVSLKEPFQFNRENPEDFSLVELKTLRALGVDRLDWKPTAERRRLVPSSTDARNKAREEEKARIEEHRRKVGVSVA